MALTREQRAEINRKNAEKSTGPKTDEGKKTARKNALKHGLRHEVLPLPHEDADAVKARADAWNDHYNPQSPAAQHLVNQCVAATLLADRVNAYQVAAVSRQIRSAEAGRERYALEQVGRLLSYFDDHPASAVIELSRSSVGCVALIYKWEDLEKALSDHGHWTSGERDMAIRLHGCDPTDVSDDPEAWTTGLLALLCQESPPRDEVAAYFAPGAMPDVMRGVYRFDALPSVADCREALHERVAEKLADLRRKKADHDRVESAARAEAPALALLTLDNEDEPRLFLRYHAEARTTFHRAYSELVKTLVRDAEEMAESTEVKSEKEVAAKPTAAKAASPNEANPPDPAEPKPAKTAVATPPEAPETAQSPVEAAESDPTTRPRAA